MKDDLITIYKDGKEIEYKLLMIIDKEYKYIIYTDKDNNELDKNLYVAKVNSIDEIDETLPLSDDEWVMVENEYKKVINNKKLKCKITLL